MAKKKVKSNAFWEFVKEFMRKEERSGRRHPKVCIGKKCTCSHAFLLSQCHELSLCRKNGPALHHHITM